MKINNTDSNCPPLFQVPETIAENLGKGVQEINMAGVKEETIRGLKPELLKRAVVMDEMNKVSRGGGRENLKRIVAMDEMNKAPREGGLGTSAGDISYIGETSRPLRDRVHKHIQCLRQGSTKSFIISA